MIDSSRAREYQILLHELVITKRRLLGLRNKEHDQALSKSEQAAADRYHANISRLTKLLTEKGIIDNFGLLTPDALELNLRLE